METEVVIQNSQTTHADFDFVTAYDAAIEATVLIDGVLSEWAVIRARVTRADGIVARFDTNVDENGHYRLEGIPAEVLEIEVLAATFQNQLLEPRFITIEAQSGQTITHDIDVSR